MPSPEVSTAIESSLDSISDEKLIELVKHFITNYDLARAERRRQLRLTPAAIEQNLQEPQGGIGTNDPLVARALAEEIFRRYLLRLNSDSSGIAGGMPETTQ